MSKVHKELIQLNSKKQIPKLKTAKGPEQFFQRGTETAAMNEKELDVTSLQGNANQNQGNANQNRGEPPPRACLEGPGRRRARARVCRALLVGTRTGTAPTGSSSMGSQNTENTTTTWPRHPTSGNRAKGKTALKRHLNPPVPRSTGPHGQDVVTS